MSKDTIYRQDAIDAFWKLEAELRPSAIDAVLDMLKNLPSAQPEAHWIPTSKERPPQHQEIWITSDFGGVELVYGRDDAWLTDVDCYTESEIVAWMPANVPEPYQPEEESE